MLGPMKKYQVSPRSLCRNRWIRFFSASLGVAGLIPPAQGQEQTTRDSLAGEKAAESKKMGEVPAGYNMHVGPIGFSIQPGLRADLNDNIYWTEKDRQSDLILKPELKINALWPITDLNSLSLSLGLGYEYYVRHDALNSDNLLISPDTDLVFNLYTGDFHFKFHESFSYQESLTYYRGANQFINLANVAKFGRYDNRIGVSADWDLNDLIFNFGFDHENFWVNTSTSPQYSYLDHATEFFWANATFVLSPTFKAGLETHASLTHYDRQITLGDQWRFGAGPFVDVAFSSNLQLRLGAGFETIQADSTPFTPSTSDSTYYAYAHLNHKINQSITHSIAVGHENQTGYNAANLEMTYIRHNATWKVFRKVDLSTHVGFYSAEESGGSYKEKYNYLQAGLDLGYQLTQRCRTSASYNYTDKESDTPGLSYYQNLLTLGITCRF